MYEIPVFEIYLDMLFLLNFIMDYIVFWIVCKITYKKVETKKLCLGAIVASVLYCVIVISPFLRNKNIIWFLFIIPLLPIQIIFSPRHIKSWIKIFILVNIRKLSKILLFHPI